MSESCADLWAGYHEFVRAAGEECEEAQNLLCSLDEALEQCGGMVLPPVFQEEGKEIRRRDPLGNNFEAIDAFARIMAVARGGVLVDQAVTDSLLRHDAANFSIAIFQRGRLLEELDPQSKLSEILEEMRRQFMGKVSSESFKGLNPPMTE